jgi:spore maturation protein CgeB
MRFCYFSHSLTSCWNHGNAHFQRGLLRCLAARGHGVLALEPANSWSRRNLAAEHGDAAVAGFSDIAVRHYATQEDIEAAIDGADVVVVHEWTDPAIVAAVGRLRRTGRFCLLFHDTHHRAVSDPDAMRGVDLSSYDAVLAFGAALAAVYEAWGWRGRVFTFHEAADTGLFRPPALPARREGAVWIGNWGDGERTAELEEFLLRPARDAGVELDIHGVRYPPDAKEMLARYGARYHGWLANQAVPARFARHEFTVHVPRRFYAHLLPGIPTIRVFEALACCIPLLCAPWDDTENLFRSGTDFLTARNGCEMAELMALLRREPALGAALAASGLERIGTRHSCDIRAGELLHLVEQLAVTA